MSSIPTATEANEKPSGDHIAVLCPPDSPALSFMPEGFNFVVGNTLEDFTGKLEDGTVPCFKGVLFVPPTPPGLLLDLWPHVRSTCTWVHSFFAGVDAFQGFFETHMLHDGKVQEDNVVRFTNGKGAFSKSLAEYVLAAALHFNKQISRCQANREQKRWEKFVMPIMKNKTMGFLGFGDIAKSAAQAAKGAFGMKIIASRRSPEKKDGAAALADEIFGQADMAKIFAQSDFVVSVLPGTPATRNIISDEMFQQMKPNGVFISIGRGTVVDEDALVRALQSGHIAGAALDVFQKEPLDKTSTLWECENLLLTAHNADYTEDYFILGWQVWADNMKEFSAGRPLVTLIDPAHGY